MDLTKHIAIARKVKAARAALIEARTNLINGLGSGPRPELQELEDVLSRLGTFTCEPRLLREHPGAPLVKTIWQGQDVGAVTWAPGRNGQRVALDEIAPADSNSPVLAMAAWADAEAERAAAEAAEEEHLSGDSIFFTHRKAYG